MAMIVAQAAEARPTILSDWQSEYSTSQSDENAAAAGTACQLCHVNQNGGALWNSYGWAIRQNLLTMTVPDNIAAFLAIETLNSDGDPGLSDNFAEIIADTQPGWTAGNNNTIYDGDGVATMNVAPPAGILGDLDPNVLADPAMTLTPNIVDFGFAELSAPATIDVEILNNGEALLTVQTIALCAGTSSEFSFTSGLLPLNLSFGETSTLSVHYEPTDLGADNGCLELTSNDPASPTILPLSGEGVDSFVDVDITRLTISKRVDLDRGDVVSIEATIQNNGIIEGDVDVTVSGAQNGTTVHSEQITVASGAPNAKTTVAFDDYEPNRLGTITWTVIVDDTDPDVDEATATTRPASRILGKPLDDPLRMAITTGKVEVDLELVASGLVAPNYGISAPGQPDALFVVDQIGVIWKIDLATGVRSPFADLSAYLVPLGIFGDGSFDERGLLGMAFHPGYAANGLVYTYTSEPLAGMFSGAADFSTMPAGIDADHHSVITEWQVPLPGDPASVVDAATRRVLLRVDQPQFNHDGGALAFGPDGLLYIAFGDGGGADDQDGQPFIGGGTVGHGVIGNGQDTSNPLGAILRIDPQGTDAANGAYGIPIGNPLIDVAGAVEEIFAWGFRNPFRMSFDTLTGDLWTGDVGQNDLEEIDIVVNGGNYGWKVLEGTFVFDDNGAGSGFVTDQDPVTLPGGPYMPPVAQYDHDDGLSAMGGFVYRGTALPALNGRYVFGDWSLSFGAPSGRLFYYDPTRLRIFELRLAGGGGLGVFVNGFGEDAAGELYVMVGETGTPFGTTGAVYRIVPAP